MRSRGAYALFGLHRGEKEGCAGFVAGWKPRGRLFGRLPRSSSYGQGRSEDHAQRIA